MKIENIKLTREENQTIKGKNLLSVSVNSGNIVASVEQGDEDINLAIVKDEAPEGAKYFATLHEAHAVSYVFIIQETEKKTK